MQKPVNFLGRFPQLNKVCIRLVQLTTAQERELWSVILEVSSKAKFREIIFHLVFLDFWSTIVGGFFIYSIPFSCCPWSESILQNSLDIAGLHHRICLGTKLLNIHISLYNWGAPYSSWLARFALSNRNTSSLKQMWYGEQVYHYDMEFDLCTRAQGWFNLLQQLWKGL